MVEAVRRQLVEADQLETAHGAMALVLAAAMDNPNETGSGLAVLSRELSRVMDEVLASAPQRPDVLDQLRARREARLAGLEVEPRPL